MAVAVDLFGLPTTEAAAAAAVLAAVDASISTGGIGGASARSPGQGKPGANCVARFVYHLIRDEQLALPRHVSLASIVCLLLPRNMK